MVPICVNRKRGKTTAVSLTVAEEHWVPWLGALIPTQSCRWPSIQEDKASISIPLRIAGVCQSFGADLGLVVLRRTKSGWQAD
jgi:hypothetical protein